MIFKIFLGEVFSNSTNKDLAAAFVLSWSIFPVLALRNLDITPATIDHVALQQNLKEIKP